MDRPTEHPMDRDDIRAALAAHRTAVTLVREGHSWPEAANILTSRFKLTTGAALHLLDDVLDRGLHR